MREIVTWFCLRKSHGRAVHIEVESRNFPSVQSDIKAVQAGTVNNVVSMKDRKMPFPTTYPLFQLVRLMSIREDGDSGKSPVVTKYAWIEAGEDNLLALYNSNGKYIMTQFFVTLRNV